ncbi:BMP family ABC transporter substrate-binding protein [Aquibacillus sp. 3ASR75-11]|uniref:BMP family ABC transporter substrate-binding protein n=1 Tax=Terrihalobacillus insolitus TaxID=2950438 RepID=A0A9X3WV87_9BACI|nr:BMP family ABC transporter substrate-binding protein [Terrihalobacillus insolitus]MDC3413697.1 BMP family ABC transporter substrate-binding protein [Terrihalobacillus insolitus]MDC3426285.1 BMP family ABC transporter substrate-binding protein [Terrihalobacillus insolitus]
MRIKNHLFRVLILIFFLLPVLTACGSDGEIQKVGMLVENTIQDQTWGNKGYRGLLQIKEEFNTDVYFKEGVTTQQEVNRAVNEFVNKGVNLIYGHSSSYGKYFVEINENYPDVQFVYFNGGYYDDNVTSLNFNALAMGFFGGMVAGEMTETNHIGLIGSFGWQPEIEGFFEGVKYKNQDAQVHMNYVNSWDDTERAMKIYQEMKRKNVDVVYPAGNSFSVPIINQAIADGLYAIGYVSDQSSLSEETVLTSTVQQVEQLYLLSAKKFDAGELEGKVLTFDFQDDVISMGDYSPEVPNTLTKEVEMAINTYIETGLLPNEKEQKRTGN